MKPAVLAKLMEKNYPDSVDWGLRDDVEETEQIVTARRKSKQPQKKKRESQPLKSYADLKEEEEKHYQANRPQYFDVKLIDDSKLQWIPEYDDEGNEKEVKKDWEHLAVLIWFPAQNKVRSIAVNNCIMLFAKFQRVIIINHIKNEAKRLKLTSLRIPHFFKPASTFIGAALGDIRPSQLEELSSDKKTSGPIYPDLDISVEGQQVIDTYLNVKDVIDCIQSFFPIVESNQLALDCVPKAINHALRGSYFTQRE